MIDREGTLKIIDFGATRVASVMELLPEQRQHEMLGTLQYSAPEYLLAEGASNRADLFSLGVIAYQMLSGRLPYGIQVARLRRHAELRKLRYVPLYELDRRIPLWVDGALRKAVHPDPRQRYEEVSEFVWDLRHPNPAFLGRHRPPLIERNPLAFWKGVSLLLLVLLLVLLATHPALR
jgi:serine/threonine protein kinase